MRRHRTTILGLAFAAVLPGLPVGMQQWQPVPLVTAAMPRAETTGGEGSQVILLVVSPSDPCFLIMGTD